MWFFAALIVLAMGGVAALAAGHGTPMSQAYDDRPDASVPARGTLGADDLRRVRFSLAFRGYRMSEVDALLERLAAERDHAATYARPPASVGGDPAGAVDAEPTEPVAASFVPPGPALDPAPPGDAAAEPGEPARPDGEPPLS